MMIFLKTQIAMFYIYLITENCFPKKVSLPIETLGEAIAFREHLKIGHNKNLIFWIVFDDYKKMAA